MRKKYYFTCLVFLIAFSMNSYGFGGSQIRHINDSRFYSIVYDFFSKGDKRLSPQVIRDLSTKLNDPHTAREARQYIGSLGLSEAERGILFNKVAFMQGKISGSEAKYIHRYLSEVPGYSAILSKISGASDAKTKGHLFELKIALETKKRGGEVRGFNYTYSDGVKRNLTDADIIIASSNRLAVVEAKNYAVGKAPSLINVRADMQSMRALQIDDYEIIRIFSMSHRPSDPRKLRLIQEESIKTGTHLVFGNPVEQAVQIQRLMVR